MPANFGIVTVGGKMQEYLITIDTKHNTCSSKVFIRCKDCNFWAKDVDGLCWYHRKYMKPYHYCADAVKRNLDFWNDHE